MDKVIPCRAVLISQGWEQLICMDRRLKNEGCDLYLTDVMLLLKQWAAPGADMEGLTGDDMAEVWEKLPSNSGLRV